MRKLVGGIRTTLPDRAEADAVRGQAHYEVRVRVEGELGRSLSSLFGELEVAAAPDGTTVLSGELSDQAALHGLLASVRDLGLALISVEAFASSRARSVEGG